MLTAVDKMSLIDGDFEKISGVDRAITDTLVDLRETLEQVEDELRALLGLDDISDADIRHVLKILN
jgi:hypothetical protein